MAQADFIHLRVHSAFSLSEGAVPVKTLVKLAGEAGMPAVAMTDSSNLFGAMEFALAARDSGVQPIIGAEITFDYGAVTGGEDLKAPLALIVQSELGYQNLLALLSTAHLSAEEHGKPVIGEELLARYSEDLLCLTGGPDGPIGRLLAAEQEDAAEKLLLILKKRFPDRLYMELQRHGLAHEAAVEALAVPLADRHEVPLVATNQVYFPRKSDYEAHDALLCIAQGTVLSDPDRRRVTPEHYFKHAPDMATLFADLPDALANTRVVAERAAFFPEPREPILPAFPTVAGRSEAEELAAQAKQGLEDRLTTHVYGEVSDAKEHEALAEPYRKRLDFELDVIGKMGYLGYFLIVADFIIWAKKEGIPVGPGRGSGAGSVVAWALTITDLDPLRWGLLFERFLNPDRVSMPDFDVDFCQEKRDRVITYVQQKYGEDRVARIITFGKLQARAALRDVGRVLQMPYPLVDRICKLVPNNPANPVSLKDAIQGEPKLIEMRESDETIARLMDLALGVEGLYRHASTHAAGVVIGDRPLQEPVPLYRDPRAPMPATQFSMKYVELAGLVKFDFLGLKTLSVLALAVKLIAEKDGPKINLSKIPLDDPEVFVHLAKAETVGLFQLESSGMRDMLKKLKADRFEDIIALVALYRPGPMDNIPSYIRRKHGEEEPDYLHPSLEGILKETYGIMVYQEQVMQIAQTLSGFSLGSADLLRRAMGKKIKAEMQAQRAAFIDGAVKNGVNPAKAADIFEQIDKFSGYGFNKCHSAPYALLAYQTAYLKTHFPVEFMAASMAFDVGNTDKLNIFRQELDRLGIALLPPDINRSQPNFSVELHEVHGKCIRYGLGAVKNVGMAAMAGVVERREEAGPFSSLDDFATRIDAKNVNKRQLEQLARAGAFEGLDGNRNQVFQGAADIAKAAAAAQEAREGAQQSLFGGASAVDVPRLSLPQVQDWPALERLQNEFEAIGFYLSAHPLDDSRALLEKQGILGHQQVMAAARNGPGRFRVAGIVVGKQERTSQKGNRFAFVQLSDLEGLYEVMLFSDVLGASRELLESNQPLVLSVNADQRAQDDAPRLLAQDIRPLEQVMAAVGSSLRIFLKETSALGEIRSLLDRGGRGQGRVKLVLDLNGEGEVELDLKEGFQLGTAIRQALKAVPGVAVQDV